MQPPNSSYNPPDPQANPALAGMTKTSLANRYFHHYSAPDSIVMSVSLCVSVCCLSVVISLELHVRSSPIFVHVTYGRGPVILCRHSVVMYFRFYE